MTRKVIRALVVGLLCLVIASFGYFVCQGLSDLYTFGHKAEFWKMIGYVAAVAAFFFSVMFWNSIWRQIGRALPSRRSTRLTPGGGTAKERKSDATADDTPRKS